MICKYEGGADHHYLIRSSFLFANMIVIGIRKMI